MKAKKLRFERVFPKGHSRSGRSTYFAEAIIKSLPEIPPSQYCHGNTKKRISDRLLPFCNYTAYDYALPINHTIRKGVFWKNGDSAELVLIPKAAGYAKSITIAEVTICKVWDFEVKDGIFFVQNKPIDLDKVQEIAKNDGFNLEEFLEWYKYPKPLRGQIICWNNKIEYNEGTTVF